MNRILLFLLITAQAFAANHYVRQGATGTGTGADWTNACVDFAGSCAVASLVRGDTYYVGVGTYVAKTWNKANSGTLVITIKKAIVADHGTATGWLDAYAAQAVFTNRMDVETDYWTFDGQVGDYGSLGIGSYGFKDQYAVGDFVPCGGTNGGTAGAAFILCGSNVTIRYLDCSGYTGTGDYNYPNQAKCIESYGGSNWTVSHVAMHGCESCLQGGADSALLEYSYIYNSRSIATNFHNNVFYIQGLSNSTLRYNQIWDYNAEGFFFTGFGGATNTNVAIYGNTFASDGTQSNFPRGIEIRQDYNYDHILIYNNTFYNLNDGAIDDLTGSTGNTCASCQGINNLAVLTGYSFGTGFTTANNTADSTTSRFVAVSPLYSANFHLTTAAGPGTTLASPYNTDMNGNVRGATGVWDRGAFEFVTGAPVVNTPSASPVAGTYTGTQTITLSTATGGATICYTTDGSTPTTNGAGSCTHGTTYAAPFTVTLGTTVVEAIGSLSGDTDSSVFSATYIILSKILTKMVILPPSTGYWIFSAANTGTIQLSLFCTYNDGSNDTTCTGGGGTVTWFTENPNALTVNSSGLATGAGAPAWVSTTTYSSGQIVSSGGAIWTALQFTTNETPGSGGSWLRGVGTSIGAYNGSIFAHAGIAVSPTALTCINIRPETTASNITLGSTILLSAEDCSSGDNVGGAAIGNYPAWTSGNTGVATTDNIGHVTAVGVGSAVITATLPGITQTRTVTVTNPTITGTTWFVRADGGTIKDTNVPGGQCDATLNVPLAGSTGGHCAVNEIMYCFTDETSNSAYTGIVKGGDTCQVAAPPAGTFYHVAQKSPGTAWITAALAPGAIAPPSGKPGSPTKLIGAGFATCESADPLHLGSCIPTVSYGAVTIELYDVQNFDVKGIDFWSGVDCIRSASPLFFNCPSGAGAREAIFVDQFTNNFTIENSRIHGYFASIAGTPGPGTVWTNVAVLYNTLTGINFDNPFGYNGNRSDGFSLVNSYIGYAGFAEELPKSLAGGSVNRDGSGHLNVTFPSGSLVNYVPGTNFVVTGNTPSDLNGTFPVTSVNFNQNTANITAVSFRGCNDGFNSVGCADFSTTAAPTFNVGDLVKLTTTSPIPSVLNGPFEVMSINTSPVGFTVAGSIFTRPGWLISGSFTGTGTASTALSLVATAAGSSESASVLGTASHVIPAHRAMDQADDTHFSNGDCVGTGNNTIGNWISIGNQFHRCTQDGWDMLHSAMISSIFTGNYVEGVEGQALKLGDADSAVVKNNFIVSTAGANMAPDSNLPPEYNQYLTTFFRAGDAFLTHNEAFDSMIFTNNTVLNVGQNVTWDDQCDSVIGCQSLPFAQFVFQNNDVIAASDTNNPVFNSSQPTIYFQGQNAPIFTTPAWNPNNNLAFQGRNPPGGIGTGNNWALGTCPTIACVANITTFAGEIASLQANWNMNLIAGSPAIGAGVNNSFTPATDFNGTTTTVPSVVGAVNLTGTVTPTAQFFGSGKFFGQQTIP